MFPSVVFISLFFNLFKVFQYNPDHQPPCQWTTGFSVSLREARELFCLCAFCQCFFYLLNFFLHFHSFVAVMGFFALCPASQTAAICEEQLPAGGQLGPFGAGESLLIGSRCTQDQLGPHREQRGFGGISLPPFGSTVSKGRVLFPHSRAPSCP